MKLSDIDILSVGNELGLVGAVWAGKGVAIICTFPNTPSEVRVEKGFPELGKEHEPVLVVDGDKHVLHVMNMDTDEWARFIRQTDLMETEILQTAKDGTVTKIILRKSSRNVEPTVQWKVFRRDECRCRYCGTDSAPLTVDHLVLWEDGGPSTENNLLSACRKCNKARGNMQYEDWLGSQYYKKVSSFLPLTVFEANEKIALALVAIPRRLHSNTR